MGKTVRWWVVAVAVLVLSAAACGSDDVQPAVTGDTTTTTETTVAEETSGDEAPTRDEYIDEADALCREADQRLEAATDALEGDETPEGAQAILEQVADIYGELHDDLAALTVPTGDEEAIQAWLDAHDAATATVEEAAQAPESATAMVTGPSPYAEADRLAAEYGFTTCGGGAGGADTGAAGTGDVTQGPDGPTGGDSTGGDDGGGGDDTDTNDAGDAPGSTGDGETGAGTGDGASETGSGTGASGGG